MAVAFYRKLKKKKAVIDKLGKEKEQVENEKRSLLQQLEDRKCESDHTIEKLKNEIIQKEKDNCDRCNYLGWDYIVMDRKFNCSKNLNSSN